MVATGKEGGALFARDAARSPATAPLRQLAMVNCEGPATRFADVPFAAAKFTVFEGLGECYWTPYYHMDGKPLWNLVFEAKPGTAYDRFGARALGRGGARDRQADRARDDAVGRGVARGRQAGRSEQLARRRDHADRARSGRASRASGRPIVPLGDAYMAFDPLGAQGANMGNRLAKTLVDAIAARGAAPFDAAWIRSTYDAFYERWGAPAMRWTHLLLEPMGAGRALHAARAAGRGRSQHRRNAQAEARRRLRAELRRPDRACRHPQGLRQDPALGVARCSARARNWEAAKGLLDVGARQIRNALSA